MTASRLASRLRNVMRMGLGAVRLPVSMIRGRRTAGFALISVDVFGTLMLRQIDEREAWRASALEFAAFAGARGLAVPPDPIGFRQSVEAAIAGDLVERSRDPEFPNHSVFEAMLRQSGAGDGCAADAIALAQGEFERDGGCCRPSAAMLESLRDWSNSGRRIVAISDTRYSSDQLKAWFENHGITCFSRIYCSADWGVSKFSGRLFDLVLATEGVAPRAALHIGDNVATDLLSAASCGLAVRWRRRPRELPPLPVGPARADDGPAFAFGYATLGPLLGGFARTLLAQARRDGISTLGFLARDGDLLHEVTRTIAAGAYRDRTRLEYLHVSRRSMAPLSPDVEDLASTTPSTRAAAAARLVRQVSAIGGRANLVTRLLSYLGVPDPPPAPIAAHLGINAGTAADALRMLSDREAVDAILAAVHPARRLLMRYLQDAAIFSSRSAIVDIGWRGTAHAILYATATRLGLEIPRGYYYGFWGSDPARPQASLQLGLIGDHRRGHGLLEGAAWNAFALLEACCRAEHGMVVGYEENADGGVRPVHIRSGAAQLAELASSAARREIRAGVFAYATWLSSAVPFVEPNVLAIRRESQRRLFRLAFFPSIAECAVGQLLNHSEPTDDNWSSALIKASAPGPRGWREGIRSPWKGGWFRLHAGMPGAAAYCAAAFVLSRLSERSILRLRSRILGEAQER